MPLREIIFDIETTGLFVDEGNKIISFGAVEMVDGQKTGREIYVLCNPGRDSEPGAFAAHRLTQEYLSQFPSFADQAQVVREFIGDSPVIFTCRTSDRNGTPYTLDRAFLDTELAAAGITPIGEEQWINVRRWSEDLFGQDGARLDKVLDHYGVSRADRDAKGHGALLDAQLLSSIYPRLKADYLSFVASGAKPVAVIAPKSNPTP
jgi:DNA polymerase III subunit epsilon